MASRAVTCLLCDCVAVDGRGVPNRNDPASCECRCHDAWRFIVQGRPLPGRAPL